MADFQQQGPITTLHRLNTDRSEEALTYFAQPDVGNNKYNNVGLDHRKRIANNNKRDATRADRQQAQQWSGSGTEPGRDAPSEAQQEQRPRPAPPDNNNKTSGESHAVVVGLLF